MKLTSKAVATSGDGGMRMAYRWKRNLLHGACTVLVVCTFLHLLRGTAVTHDGGKGLKELVKSEVLLTETPGPPLVLLLSYQRSGSSFMGDLFDKHPSMFYVYEPLDAVYSALYGVAPGWSVPSDITGNSDGSLREIPAMEVEAVTKTVSQIYECCFDELPTEVLLRHFWLKFPDHNINVRAFTDCLRQRNISIPECHTDILQPVCAKRFGTNEMLQESCRHRLEQDNDDVVRKYRHCLEGQREGARPCVTLLESHCHSADVRAVKTVRATMAEAEVLMRRHSNLKLLHLLRDPRALLLSRMKNRSFRSFASIGDISMEARFYCRIVEQDLQRRESLHEQFPGRIKEVIYEDFLLSPVENAKDIYGFVGLDIAPRVEQWLNKTASVTAFNMTDKWISRTTERERQKVKDTCAKVFEYKPHQWQ